MEPDEDAYGQAIRDHYESEEAFEVVERDDGWVGPSAGPALYFSEYEDWDPSVRDGLDGLAETDGRVLDVGCGAGRHGLYLQEQGLDVTGIDVSPGAVEVSRERGLADVRECDVGDVAAAFDPDTFDAVVMLGNNFGLVGTADRAPAVLSGLATVTTADATLLAGTADPYETDDSYHADYHEYNRERGRLGGALRIRVRYRTHATDWFDYLMVSREEMRDVVADTPWTVSEFLDGEDGNYVGVLEKER